MTNGGNGVDAARQAGYKGSYATLNTTARENLQKPLIKAAIDEHREAAKEVFTISVERKQKWLETIIERSLQAEPVVDADGSPTGEYKFEGTCARGAIAELNKMSGDYAPTKQEVKIDEYAIDITIPKDPVAAMKAYQQIIKGK